MIIWLFVGFFFIHDALLGDLTGTVQASFHGLPSQANSQLPTTNCTLRLSKEGEFIPAGSAIVAFKRAALPKWCPVVWLLENTRDHHTTLMGEYLFTPQVAPPVHPPTLQSASQIQKGPSLAVSSSGRFHASPASPHHVAMMTVGSQATSLTRYSPGRLGMACHAEIWLHAVMRLHPLGCLVSPSGLTRSTSLQRRPVLRGVHPGPRGMWQLDPAHRLRSRRARRGSDGG